MAMEQPHSNKSRDKCSKCSSNNTQELTVSFVSWISGEALGHFYATNTIVSSPTSNLHFDSERRLK